jgi:AmmeMemoRadiSam system protein B
MRREMSVAGSFYPARASEIERYFEHFSKIYDENSQIPKTKARAVIVPHAGYVYSGYTANCAYRVLQNSGVKNILVVGPSHRIGFYGSSLGDYKYYKTPFGEIGQSEKIHKMLQEQFNLPFMPQAHAEHSTEVQFPFIKHYLGECEIVELVYSSEKAEAISEIIDFVLDQEDCAVVISTDLSHFYTLKNANELDNVCLNAIENLDVGMLGEGCEACGMIGVEAMIRSAKKLGLHSHILDYRTSADSSGDESRVVGYVSAYFTE